MGTLPRTTKRWPLYAAAVCLALSAVVAPNGAAQAATDGTGAPDLPPGVELTGDQRWLSVAELKATDTRRKDLPGAKVEAWGKDHDAVGMSFDDTTGYSVALPPGASAADLAKASTASVGVSFTVRRSSMTKADVDAVASDIRSFAGKHPTHRFGFSFDAATDATHVETDAPTAVVASLKKEVRGAIDVRRTPRADAPKTPRACAAPPVNALVGGKNNDVSPHYGGASINWRYCTACSSGFAMRAVNGPVYQLTAGHCFGDGYQVGSGDNFYGQIDNAQFPIWDLAKITGSQYVSAVYRTEFTATQVSGASDPTLGHPGQTGICVSGGGYATQERCGASIRNLNATLCVQGQCTNGLATFSRGSQSQMAGYGDSGGPVYFVNNSNGRLHMQGIYVGGSPYQYYLEKYSSIRSLFSGSVHLG